MIDSALMSQVKALSPAERLELIGAVWESLEASDIPVTEAEKALISERMSDVEDNPSDESAWSNVRERLRKRLS